MKKHRFCRCFQISLSYAFDFQVSFENSEAHGDEEGHNEVVEGYNDQRREWLEADALNGSGSVHEVCHADDGDLGGFLDQCNEFVADNGKDIPDGLRYDDTDHGFPFGESQGHGPFQLAFRYGLDAGADDYLTKPFGINELMARVNSLIRRYTTLNPVTGNEAATMLLKDMVIDKVNRTVTVQNIPVELTGKEFDLLLVLASNKGRVFTKKQLYTQVWTEEYDFDDNNIMAFISKLRKKIEPNPEQPFYIQTVRGVGYRFNKEA